MANTYQVTVVDCDHPSIEIEQNVLRAACPQIAWKQCKSEEQIIAECQEGEVLLVQYAPMTARVLKALPKCKAIVRYGVGVDTIDLKAAAEYGISVSNVPDYGTHEVSDQALAMLLCLTRKVAQADRLVKQGKWDFRLMMPVRRLQQQTLGIIGLGRIGGALAHKAHAIGMRIVAYDPLLPPQAAAPYVSLVGLDQLLMQADMVSVHCPLSADTCNLINADKLALMKSTAYLVNTARGGIVDEVALEAALRDKKLAGAAMDVLSKEPSSVDHPLFKYDNFYCTPHMAWHSEEAAQELKRKVAEEAMRCLHGERLLYRVN